MPMFEDACEFLEKSDPDTLMFWLRNAAETKSVKLKAEGKNTNESSYWWYVSQLFEEAGYKIKELKKKQGM